MDGWIFDFNPHHPEPKASAAAAAADDGADDADGVRRVQAAAGDDAALLALLRETSSIELKLAVVAALTGEAALKAAEIELRERDRRVHRLAKQRYALAVARREARVRAASVIEAARALAVQPLIPLNHLVDVDRAWRAQDIGLLEAAQRAEYDALMAQIGALMRERADQPLKLKRWTEQARDAQAGLATACAEAAAGSLDRAALAAAGAAARAVIDAAPQDAAGAPVLQALARADSLRAQLDERLAVLDELLGGAPASEPADRTAAAELPAHVAADAHQRWTQLAPLGDAALDAALQQRFGQWQQAREETRAARRAQRRDEVRERQRAIRDERVQSLAAVLDLAEATLDAGQLAATHDHLVEIDRLLDGGASAGTLRARIDGLQARYSQLKGWQHWAGGRARDELVQQAEALAAAAAGPDATHARKLTTRQLAEVIDDLRARWKELDRLGGATSRSLWQRFDAALTQAYEPVAAQVAALRTAREQNLLARRQLLDALEATPVAGGDGDAAPPDWRALAAALDHFTLAWRRLGPIEHTVPNKARGALVERMNAALQRVEAPLHEVRRGARLQRERLVERARALASAAPGRDLVDRARELQAQWQQQARAMVLARADENALWADFKGAIDAAFVARESVFQAREAEFQAHGAERTALIERLEALDPDTPVGPLRRALADADQQWRRLGPAPRQDAAALDDRFRRARDAVLQRVAEFAQRAWQASCDALEAKLALCDELERAPDRDAAQAELAARWSALPALPDPLEQALARRAGLASAGARAAARELAASTDDLLLKLEAAWGLASPADCEAARRALKLQAMKAALETRRPTAEAATTPDAWLAALLGRTDVAAAQRERLGAVLAELRRRGSIDAA